MSAYVKDYAASYNDDNNYISLLKQNKSSTVKKRSNNLTDEHTKFHYSFMFGLTHTVALA